MSAKALEFLRAESRGPDELLSQAEAVVEAARNEQQLLDFAMCFWPRTWWIRGDEKLRLLVDGHREGRVITVRIA